jgi:aspartate racemase
MKKLKIIHAKSEKEIPDFKTVGILGGMGQWATLDIIERILQYSARRAAQFGNRGYPPMVIQMINESNILLNPKGTAVIEPLRPAPVLLEMAMFVGANADILIMTAHTAHVFRKEVEAAAGKPIISIVDVAVNEVVKRGNKKVGIMAIGPTVRSELYQQPLRDLAVKSVILPDKLMKKLDDEAIYMVQEGEDPADFTKPIIEAINYFKDQKVDGIILGCTELPILLKAVNDPIIINPSQLLAEAAVEAALKS